MPTLEFFEDVNHELVLRYTPGAPEPIDSAAIIAAATAAGYGDLQLDKAALDGAVRRIRNKDYFSVAIGVRTDAEYQVEVARDHMSATLTALAAHGGIAANVGAAGEALGRAGVVFGVDSEALAAVLAAPAQAVVVARGAGPQGGVNGRLETLIDIDQTHRPKEDEKGQADFRDIGLLYSVEAATPLLRRHPPQPAKPGRTVMGVEIGATQPKDAKFPVRLKGVEISSNDPNLLVAAISGQPVIRRDSVSVEPVLVLPEVGLATGNIDFDGTVEVRGDVQSGMKIKASGDVIIHGTLESAEVDAAGEVEVKGGIIGQRTQAGSDTKPSGALIHARRNVRAHHVDNATILAEQSVLVDEVIVQSDITAMEEVLVGKEGARRGHIIGGTVRATRTVTANCLGGPGSSKTHIMVGMNPPLVAAVEEKKMAAAAKRKEQDDLAKVVKVLQTRPEKAPLLAKAQLTLDKTCEDLNTILSELSALEAELQLADKSEVVVKSAVHPGVAITIGRKFTVVADNLGAGTFRLAIDASSGREEEIVAFQR